HRRLHAVDGESDTEPRRVEAEIKASRTREQAHDAWQRHTDSLVSLVTDPIRLASRRRLSPDEPPCRGSKLPCATRASPPLPPNVSLTADARAKMSSSP